VIVGAGQVVQRPGEGEALDPIELTLEALRRAAADSGAGERLLLRADSIRHVATLSWPYRDEAALIAEALGASPRETVRTCAFGGDSPQRLLGDSARPIAEGDAEVVLLAGAEAFATLAMHRREGTQPGWPQQPSGAPARVVGEDREPCNVAEKAVGLIAPLHVYALLETAVRAGRGVDRAEHLKDIAALWSRFSSVAAQNPFAWHPRSHTPDEIAGALEGNRLVSEPYTKLLTANIQVDQAAALILCSARAAQEAGVPKDRWVFPLASSFAQDEWHFSERAQLDASPAIRAAAGAVLEHARVSVDELALIDLYSCFPSAVEIAARELGLSPYEPGRPLTVTGGLTFAGGPGNNYAMHAIATLVSRLREQPDAIALSSALGWYCTKHAYGLYSGAPPAHPFREIDAKALVVSPPARRANSDYAGDAVLEAYTVAHARDGTPEALIVSALAPDGTRALSRDDDPATAAAFLERDPLGETIAIEAGERGRLGLGGRAGR
jgi:acetyl-CoA C-acetyltransferase